VVVVEKPPDEEFVPERSIMEIDSVIDDGDIYEFTSVQDFMRGAPLSPDVLRKLESTPARSEFISNMSATKTGFQTNHIYKDF
jgi:hypothetical protein